MTMEAIAKGFTDPVLQAQEAFRVVMNGFAHPGTVNRIALEQKAETGLSEAATAIALALFDYSTRIWLDPDLGERGASIARYLQFHTDCPYTQDRGNAAFGILNNGADLTSFDGFPIGTPEYPDRSAMLIIPVEGFSSGQDLRLSGPGIDGVRNLSVDGVPEGFWSAVQRNAELFPLGIDFILVAGEDFVCLPRSTKVER